MKKTLRLLGWVAFWSYVAALFALGAFGILAPDVELALMYDVSLEELEPFRTATILHQYRFLKVFVLGVGVLAVMFRHRILAPGQANALFLGLLFGAAGARVLSIFLDGAPHARLIPFTVSEFVMGLLILIASRLPRETILGDTTT